MLGDVQARLAKVEAKPGFEEALNDPGMRERLAAVVMEARGAGGPTAARPPSSPQGGWRDYQANRCRGDYAKVLAEARAKMKLDDAAWKELAPVFERHFAPVDAALKELTAGRTSNLPKVNELVAPGLPGTLSAVKGAVSAEAWQAFEAWRKAEEPSGVWGSGKGDFFLESEEFKKYQANRSVQMHWQMLQMSLPMLYAKLALDAEKKGKFEAVLKAHVSKAVTGSKDAAQPDFQSDEGRARLRALTAETEKELAGIVGPEGLGKFQEWKTAPGNRAAMYFGAMSRDFVPPGAGGPGGPVPGPSAPGGPARPSGPGPERF
jgi:hypothetical protein